jgi:glycosyltransferase involved in cell wall biosynthesis
MKIVIILQNLGGGGAERAMVNLANGFVKKGLAVTILLGSDTGVYKHLLNKSIKVETYNATSLFGSFFGLRKFFKTNKFDVAITPSDYVSAACRLAIKFGNLSIKQLAVLEYDLSYHIKLLPKLNQLFLKALNKFVVSKANYVAGVSNGVGNGFKKVVGNSVGKVHTLYNPVFDEQIFIDAQESVNDFVFENGYSYLVNVGRLEYQKNQELLINAVQQLKSEGRKVKLLILGVGVLQKALEKQIENLDLKDDVFLLGFQKNPFKYVAKSDMFVLSSRYEGLPTVLIEALALGVNAVSTNCPSGPAEIFEGELLGDLCETENVNALVDAIKKNLDNRRSSSLLMQHTQKYSIKETTNDYLNLLVS